jgi:hypothetical protein
VSDLAPVAVLFVQDRGVYFALPAVDLWPEARDARRYAGDARVLCHPPCARWSKLAYVVQAKGGPRVGADDGCFASALASVRRCGGVLEHPAVSAAWPAHGLAKPPARGGWVPAGDGVGWTCCVYQRNYGHRAAKPTWLYAVGTARPALRWGPGPEPACRVEWMAGRSREREATPPEFCALLLWLARSAPGDEPVMGCPADPDVPF